MGSKKNVNMSTEENTVKIVGSQEETNETVVENQVEAETADVVAEAAKPAARKTQKIRSRKYQAARALVDKTKTYDAFAAVELLKKLSYSHFAGTITADAIVKEEGTQVSVTFPFSTGKSIKVGIVNEDLLKEIEAGNVNYDVIITEPRFMPQLAKFAKVLGPKGLMPNPKNGTVTANPELKKKELESGKVTLKAERKAPLMHVGIGKTDMDTKELVENLTTFMTALRGKLLKLSISASMSPSIKVTVV